jgi:hypothetical protein
LCTFFQIHPIEKIATLTIADTTSDDKLEFCSELFPFGNGSAGQCIAGGYTYIKRQLFISAFNIVENDNLEEQETKRMLEAEQERNKQAAQPTQPQTQSKPIENIGKKRTMVLDFLAEDESWREAWLRQYNREAIGDFSDEEINTIYERATVNGKIEKL